VITRFLAALLLHDIQERERLTKENRLDEFLIPSSAGAGSLLFFNRLPVDRKQPLEDFSVRLTDHNLSAVATVYAGYIHSNPVELFADMAKQWHGWKGELCWSSLEEEMALCCSRDRLGHVAIRVHLRPGHMPYDWRVEATVMTEAGQLEAIAKRAVIFFGTLSIQTF
jgi:hypothetical protein